MQASVQQVKNGLSHYLTKVLKGKELIISRYNVPVARLVPMETPRPKNKTVLGRSRGLGRIQGKVTGPFLKETDWLMLTRKRS